MAGFPGRKTIDSFDFGFQPSVDRRQIKDLVTLRFMSDGVNIILLGCLGSARRILRWG